jgi:hypothetical protein
LNVSKPKYVRLTGWILRARKEAGKGGGELIAGYRMALRGGREWRRGGEIKLWRLILEQDVRPSLGSVALFLFVVGRLRDPPPLEEPTRRASGRLFAFLGANNLASKKLAIN